MICAVVISLEMKSLSASKIALFVGLMNIRAVGSVGNKILNMLFK